MSHVLDQVPAVSVRIAVLRDGQRLTTQGASNLGRRRLINLMRGREQAEETSHGRGA